MLPRVAPDIARLLIRLIQKPKQNESGTHSGRRESPSAELANLVSHSDALAPVVRERFVIISKGIEAIIGLKKGFDVFDLLCRVWKILLLMCLTIIVSLQLIGANEWCVGYTGHCNGYENRNSKSFLRSQCCCGFDRNKISLRAIRRITKDTEVMLNLLFDIC